MKKFFMLSLIFVLAFFVFSCDTKKKKSEDVTDIDGIDADAEITDEEGIIPDDNTDPDEIAVVDDEPDTEKEDEDSVVIDPCNPNPCNEPNRSVCEPDGLGYKCLCDKFTCEINGECFKDGDLNPFDSCSSCNRDFSETEFTVRPDGSECEAVAGTMGSGICRKGLCGGFGNCDSRAYKQGPGYPCNYDSECATGRCYYLFDWAGGMSVVNVCTGTCKEDEDCPGDMLCQYSNEYGYECLPRFTSTVIKPDPLMADYKPCNNDDDCDGGLCLAYGSTTFCSKDCERSSGGGKDLLACGTCGECKDNGDELGFKFKYFCTPDGSGKTGGNCQSGMDCSSGACYDNYCTAACGSLLSPCPSGYECMEDVYQEDVETCVDKARLNIADGFSCAFDYQCVSGECVEFPYGKYCSKHCDTEACSAGDCVQIGDPAAETPEMACAPLFMPGYAEYGENCTFDWECEKGLECQDDIKMCTKACEKDEDCPDGVCYAYLEDLLLCVPEHQYRTKPDGYLCYFGYECQNECWPDYTLQKYYCTSKCSDDSDCFDIAGCNESYCNHAYPWRSYTYGMCRFDDDCEKNTLCIEGFCTSECTADSNCAGYAAVVPEEGQKTCKPCTNNTECQNVFYDYGQCVTGSDGSRFCAEDCTDDPSLCPEGTRCYGVGSGGICFPLSGLCSQGHTTCSADDVCIVGRLENDWACREDGECKSGICEGGVCQEGTCSDNDDCGCEMIECKSGNCLPKVSAGTKEVEPNDTVAQAQVLSGSGFTVAYFNHSGNVKETDVFKVSVKKDEYLNVRTHPFCGHDADTYLRFLDSTGKLIGEWENDDINPNGWFFSELLGFFASTAQDIFIEVTQSPLTSQPQNVPYLLEVQMFTPVSNSACENAEVLTPGTYDRTIKKAVNTIESGACSGGYGYGPDLFYKVNVPAGKLLTFRVTPDSAEFDPELSILSECGSVSEKCLAGNAFGYWGEPEELSYLNSTAEAKDYIVILDTPMLPFEYDFVIQIDIADASVPVNDKIAGAIPLSGTGSVNGTTIAAVDDYAPAKGICDKVDLDGLDVVYSIDLKAGEYFHITVAPTFGAAIYTVKSTDLDTCVSGGGAINYETETDELLYLIIDSASPSTYGTFVIDHIISTTGPCEGLCDTAEHRECSDETTLCMCDTETGLLKPTDCNQFCIDSNGALSGGCKSNDDGMGCVCTHDCTDTVKVTELCSDGYITNCTCAASDPCSWVGDTYCNSFCADFFPADHFDDSADCTE
jgi:hypothetical protein